MQYMKLGETGVTISKIAFGTFAIGGGTAWSIAEDDEKALIEAVLAAIDHGMTTIDTAPVYGTSRAEILLGKILKERGRDKIVLATKCCLHWRGTSGRKEYDRDGKSVYRSFEPASIRKDLEESLARLQTEYIDIYIVHREPKPEEIPPLMETLTALKREGVIRAVGFSNASPETVSACLEHGRVDLVQEAFSYLLDAPRQAYFELCEREGIVFQAFGLLEHGALAKRPPDRGSLAPGDFRVKKPLFQPSAREALDELFDAVTPLAVKYRCSVPALFVAWADTQMDSMNLLVGSRRANNVRDAARAADIAFEPDDIGYLNHLRIRIGRKIYGNECVFASSGL